MKRTSKLTSFSCCRIQVCVAAALLFLVSAAAAAQTEAVLYSFVGGTDGGFPTAGLIQDAEGNFYGTTAGNEDRGAGWGTVFELTPTGTETVLYAFLGEPDGDSPQAGLIRDAQGNLYGTTSEGGYGGLGLYGSGTVFEVTAAGTETIVHSFTGGGLDPTDGFFPSARLVQDADGNLYGTTAYGGDCFDGGCDYGTVFEITPSGTETILHSFTGSADGGFPYADLTRDANGNLYGTTAYGGVVGCGCGVIFELDAAGKFRVLHGFIKAWVDGANPYSGLVLDEKGNFYGTTGKGGGFGRGTVFEVTPNSKENVLHRFREPNGSEPLGGLVRDAEGNLYGTTEEGGAFGQGTVFEVTAAGVERVLYSFSGGADGRFPSGDLLRDAQGNLYGTTEEGGSHGLGTVFKITP